MLIRDTEKRTLVARKELVEEKKNLITEKYKITLIVEPEADRRYCLFCNNHSVFVSDSLIMILEYLDSIEQNRALYLSLFERAITEECVLYSRESGPLEEWIHELLDAQGVPYTAISLSSDSLMPYFYFCYINKPTPSLFVKQRLIDCDLLIASKDYMNTVLAEVKNSRIKNSVRVSIENILSMERIVAVTKGSKESTTCSCTKEFYEVLDSCRVEYGTFDVLCDSELREAFKMYSDCNSYPQLYVDGKFVGGLLMLKEIVKSGGYKKLLRRDE